MLNSLEVEVLLIDIGFVEVETKTHALGFAHPALNKLVYVKDGRAKLSEPRKAVYKQPLVVHSEVQHRTGFGTTQIATMSPNPNYMNGNMSTFPSQAGSSATGIAVDVPDRAALRELLEVMGLTSDAPPTEEQDIAAATNLPEDETERRAVIDARRGQGRFRKALQSQWNVCAVTGCTHPALLRASHIKPWRECDNRERLDPDNGLLLAAHVDAAFDRGLISFADDGRVLLNHASLSREDAEAIGVDEEMRLRRVSPGHLTYLHRHRALHGFKV